MATVTFPTYITQGVSTPTVAPGSGGAVETPSSGGSSDYTYIPWSSVGGGVGGFILVCIFFAVFFVCCLSRSRYRYRNRYAWSRPAPVLPPPRSYAMAPYPPPEHTTFKPEPAYPSYPPPAYVPSPAPVPPADTQYRSWEERQRKFENHDRIMGQGSSR